MTAVKIAWLHEVANIMKFFFGIFVSYLGRIRRPFQSFSLTPYLLVSQLTRGDILSLYTYLYP